MAASECTTCGVCCFSELDAYVRVTGDDHARLADDAERLVRFDGFRAFMRMTDGHCAALSLNRDGRFLCSIYSKRPGTCRELDRGSPACAGELATKGERPLIALRRKNALDPVTR